MVGRVLTVYCHIFETNERLVQAKSLFKSKVTKCQIPPLFRSLKTKKPSLRHSTLIFWSLLHLLTIPNNLSKYFENFLSWQVWPWPWPKVFRMILIHPLHYLAKFHYDSLNNKVLKVTYLKSRIWPCRVWPWPWNQPMQNVKGHFIYHVSGFETNPKRGGWMLSTLLVFHFWVWNRSE